METISKEEAMKELRDLRGGNRGQDSMFDPWLEEFKDLGPEEVFTNTVEGYGRVSGLRNFLDNRGYGDILEVKSAREDGQEDLDQSEATYKVFVFRE